MNIIKTETSHFAKDNSDFGHFHDIKKFDLIDRASLNLDCLDIHDFFISKTHDSEKMFTKRSRRKIDEILSLDDASIFVKTGDRKIYCLQDNNVYRIKLSDIPVKPLTVVGCRFKKIVLSNLKNDFVVIDTSLSQVSLLRFDWKVISCAFLANDLLLFTTRETVDGPGEIICVDSNLNYLWTFIFNRKTSHLLGEVSVFPYRISSDNKNSFISSCVSTVYFFSERKAWAEINRPHIVNGEYYSNFVKGLYYTINDNFMAVWDDGFFAVFDKHGSLVSDNGKECRNQKTQYIYNSFLCENYVVNFCFEDKIYQQTAYIYNLQGNLLHAIDIDFEPFSVSIFDATDTLIVMSGHIANEGNAIRKCCYFNLSTGALSDFDFTVIHSMKNYITGLCMSSYLWLSEQMVS